MPQAPEQQSFTSESSGAASKISKNRLILPDPESARLRARERLQQIEKERTEAATARRADRVNGRLTQGLHEGLRACTPLQLKTVRKLVSKYEKDHRTPPSLGDCREKQTVEILAHADVYNRRYTLELRRSSRSRGRVYVNGPYAVVHHRDGAIIKHDYIGNKKLSTRLPRKVWPVFRTLMTSPNIRARIEQHNKAWAEREDEE